MIHDPGPANFVFQRKINANHQSPDANARKWK